MSKQNQMKHIELQEKIKSIANRINELTRKRINTICECCELGELENSLAAVENELDLLEG